MTSPELLAIFANLVALIFAITSHEAAHGAMAFAFGDDTAKRAGRLSFNPLRHVDPFGTVILPGLLFLTHAPMLFGWAKPVPVDFLALRPKRLGMILVAFAGPGANIMLAWISALLLHINGDANTLGNEILVNSFHINLFLAVFNLLPIPPLDGGRIAVGLLPRNLAMGLAKIEPYGLMILMLTFFVSAIVRNMGIPFNPVMDIMLPVVRALSSAVLFLSGH
ncbi:MAG: site-2 protease family protein [Alphaproteobacteria bacterium]|nr:site-2 protease family protein [Alphaproteobacteria bacterium]